MSVCDVEVTANIVDENLENEIDEALLVCDKYYQECRDLFTDESTGIVQKENLANCYERYSFEKTARFCVDQSEKVVSDQIRYKKKHKYECLT